MKYTGTCFLLYPSSCYKTQNTNKYVRVFVFSDSHWRKYEIRVREFNVTETKKLYALKRNSFKKIKGKKEVLLWHSQSTVKHSEYFEGLIARLKVGNI